MTRARRARFERRLRSCGLNRSAIAKVTAVLELVRRERPMSVAQAEQLIVRATRGRVRP